MKTLRSNTTTQYEPHKVTEAVNLHFRKEENGNNVTVYGYIMKNGNEIGVISYDQVRNSLSTTIKQYADMTMEEVKAVYAAAPDCIDEILNGLRPTPMEPDPNPVQKEEHADVREENVQSEVNK